MLSGVNDLKKALPFIIAIIMLVLLCGCSSHADEPAPTPTPTPTPVPTPTPITEIKLTDESAEEILNLIDNSLIREVDGSMSRQFAALLALYEARPDVDVHWVYDYKGSAVPSDTAELTLTDTEGIEDLLRYVPGLKKLDLLALDISVEQMDLWYEIRPDIDYLWNVSFGSWTVRSDITCFSTLRTGDVGSHRYTNEELYPLLKYCRKLRALDLGHNDIDDISLLADMKELQILILADNARLTDISPLAGLTDLEYLELFLCWDIVDTAPLYNLTKLECLNMSYCKKLSDIGYIENMPNFSMGWFRTTSVTWDQCNAINAERPEITFVCGNPSDVSATCYGWRSTTQSNNIRSAFTYWRYVKEFRHWDDVEYIDNFR